jgi:hypothetical protein
MLEELGISLSQTTKTILSEQPIAQTISQTSSICLIPSGLDRYRPDTSQRPKLLESSLLRLTRNPTILDMAAYLLILLGEGQTITKDRVQASVSELPLIDSYKGLIFEHRGTNGAKLVVREPNSYDLAYSLPSRAVISIPTAE